MAEWCPPCKKMDNNTFSNTNIINKSNEFIPVRIDVDKQQDIAKEYNGNARKYGVIGIPNILFLENVAISSLIIPRPGTIIIYTAGCE